MDRNRLFQSPIRRMVWSLFLLLLPMFAAAATEEDLLPVDEAFAVTTRALDRNTIEFHIAIAPGYYLYRERTKAEAVDPAMFRAEPLQTPPGEAKDDEFFGRVETWRNEVVATLVGEPAAGVDTVSIKFGYQGCADIGICYPPQRKIVQVDLPAGLAAATNAGGLDLGLAPANTGAGLGLPGAASPAPGATDALPLPEDEAFRFEAIAANESEFLLRFTMPPNYYLYRDRSGFALADASLGELGSPKWPAAQSLLDPEFGQVDVFFDLVEIPLAIARSSNAAGPIRLTANFQGCIKDGVCYPPMSRTLIVDFPETTTAARTAAAESIAAVLKVSVPVPATDDAGPSTLPTVTFWQALLWALAGGLILNLMPCVLPVLSLKVLSLTSSGETPAKARAHALWYTAGVLASFAAVGLAVIAFQSTGAALGWGFQLQQPVFVGLMGFVMLAFGLSLSGLFVFGGGLANIGQGLVDKGGAKGDFFTGVLAVVVASPCTAPLMGPALSFAFKQSPAIALVIFLALGLGLALPFLLIGFVPAFAKWLPKPGAWMETLKQWLAFPLYVTAIWLAWVLGQQRGADAMAIWLLGALALTAALWWWEKERYADAAWRRVLLSVLLAAASVWTLTVIHRLPVQTASAADTSQTARPWSPETLASLRAANTPVFVNMTADWCVSCKVNERSTLAGERFKKALADTGTVYLKGDWTNEDPAITAFLAAHDTVGVPLYVYFAPGARDGVVLPTILTPDIVDTTIRGTR